MRDTSTMGLIDLPRLPMTAEEFQELPQVEGARVELWGGNLVVMAAAQMWWHADVAHRVVSFFREGGCSANHELGVIVAPRDVPIPDVVVFRERVTDTRRSQFPAHDVACVVEIVSPESIERDTKWKPARYAAARIPEFWLITEDPDDPSEADVEIYRLTPGGTYELSRKWELTDLEAAGYDSRLGFDSRLGA